MAGAINHPKVNLHKSVRYGDVAGLGPKTKNKKLVAKQSWKANEGVITVKKPKAGTIKFTDTEAGTIKVKKPKTEPKPKVDAKVDAKAAGKRAAKDVIKQMFGDTVI
ncbi:hypothetical protein ACFL52_01670 [Candidatus Margulisiibacteriota bacterium]